MKEQLITQKDGSVYMVYVYPDGTVYKRKVLPSLIEQERLRDEIRALYVYIINVNLLII